MKYYQINPNVIFRNYGDFGYITDNRNFGYHFTNTSYVLGDRIVSESGAVILSCLEKSPRPLVEILNRVMKRFVNANEKQLKFDIESFLQTLSEAGFIIMGESADECRAKSCCSILREADDTSVSDNSLSSTQAFFEKKFGDKPFPVSVHIEIVSKCNERCIHCYIPHEYKNQVMAAEMFYDLMDQCQDLKIQHVTISGGEPMLHQDFIPFLKKCREYDMSVNVLSNLTLLNNDMIDEMRRNPLLGVQTSIYSMKSEIHDSITGGKAARV